MVSANPMLYTITTVLCCFTFYISYSSADPLEVYTNTYAVHIEGGEERAHQLAKRHGFINLGQILPDHYHFWDHRNSIKRSLRETSERHVLLRKEPEVRWIEQQKVKRRTKRDFNLPAIDPDVNYGEKAKTKVYDPHLNDALWSKLWYLRRGNGLDMNVLPAWKKGYTGKGVVVSILDDGIEKDHPDLRHNYDAAASYDVNGNDPDPQPRYDYSNENRHGTRCAGEVAAEANNTICSVGVAYRAGIGGVRMLDGDVTDVVEGRSLSLNPDHIDIYSASWGPDDDGLTVDGPGKMAKKAFADGVVIGRGGLGSIFVWASGNGGRSGDSCGCDGYTNSIFTISVSSATERGKVPWYSEKCSSTLATTYSSGEPGDHQVVTTDLRKVCTENHSGTSASAPLAAGLCALALEANPKLTWRDLQHIIVATSRPDHLDDKEWVVNGAGYKVSHSFGFGLMDASAMVDMARDWQRIPDQHICSTPVISSPMEIPPRDKLTVTTVSTGCNGSDNDIQSLEHVIAKVSIKYSRRGDLEIALISPSGTRSVLLPRRAKDYSNRGFTDWEFLTTHCWGEIPTGTWTLEIQNKGSDHNSGQLTAWELILYGTEVHPLQKHSGPQECPPSYFLGTSVTKNKTILHECLPCHSSCKSCFGAHNNQCIECQFHYQKRDTYCIQNVSLLKSSSVMLIAAVVGVLLLLLLVVLVGFFVYTGILYHPRTPVATQEYSKLLEEDFDSSDGEEVLPKVAEYQDHPEESKLPPPITPPTVETTRESPSVGEIPTTA